MLWMIITAIISQKTAQKREALKVSTAISEDLSKLSLFGSITGKFANQTKKLGVWVSIKFDFWTQLNQ